MAYKINIGYQNFNTKKGAFEYIQDLLYNKIGVCNSVKHNTCYFNIFFSLIQNHPDFETKCKNVIDFKIIPNKLNKKALELRIIKIKDNYLIDEDISWRLCITKKSKSTSQKLKIALRYSIEYQIKIFRKNSNINDCILCNKKINSLDSHVDHENYFEKIIQDFHSSIKNINIIPTDFDDTDDDTNRCMFKQKDEQYENLWKQFHFQNAKLRIICSKCNLSRKKYKA